MSVPLWVVELAEEFWAGAGNPPPLPRDLRDPAERGLPLSVVGLAGLRLSGVLGWLARAGVGYGLDEPDRPLRACLVARGGFGFVFVDRADDEAERRFSLAHEVAHFLRDYLRPRRQAVGALGAAVLEVLDGRRAAGPEERLHALLRNVRVGFHAHLLARDAGGRAPGALAGTERAADRLAYELLAPASAVLAGGRDFPGLVRRLRGEFGLPPAQAADYAALLAPPATRPDPLLGRLRLFSGELSNSDPPRGKG